MVAVSEEEWWASMTTTDTPNAGRCWWGWGTIAGLKQAIGGIPLIRPLAWQAAAGQLRAPRIAVSALPLALKSICTDHPFERLLHSRGRDFVDIASNLHGVPPEPTDLVAFPENEAQISALFAYCSSSNVAVVPFGGGSSVAFGINPPADVEGYTGTVTVDLLRFSRVLEVDKVSMCARVQAGVYGPNLEKQLKTHGVTLRYFPQSFEFSTVGGWVATRGGGHFATGPTHMDDLVESVRLVTPAGVTETRRLPGSGAGPAEHRLYVGSEGILGIITEVWVRVRRVPSLRASATVLFSAANADEAFMKGAKAVMDVSQSGLQPANLRLVYGEEVARMTQDDKLDASAVLLVGFEASEEHHNLDHSMEAVLRMCEAHGGALEGKRPASFVRRGGGGDRDGIAGKWGSGFMKGGYTFSAAACSGILLNTFETAITWDRFFKDFHFEVLKAARAALTEQCGGGSVTCRFTHIYPDGPAPYYTVLAAQTAGTTPGMPDLRMDKWLRVKAAAMKGVMEHGGTATHHHAVGKLHREHYHRELGALYVPTLEAVKRAHDPAWVLNPGVLLRGRPAGLQAAAKL